MGNSVKYITSGLLMVLMMMNKFSTCEADSTTNYDPVVDAALRTGALNFFFLPPPYGLVFGSIAYIGVEAYIHHKHPPSNPSTSSFIDSSYLIKSVNTLVMKNKESASFEAYSLNNELISKDLSENFNFLDDCYRGMCFLCLVKNHTCPISSSEKIKNAMLDETSEFRTKLANFVHNYIAPKSQSIATRPVLRIFELRVENYKQRVQNNKDCGNVQSEHTKIYSMFMSILALLEKSYSFVLLASINKYNSDIAMNDTREAAQRWNYTIKIINDLYEDTDRLVKEVKMALNETSRDIRPCDPVEGKRGKTWQRLTNFIQADFFAEERGFINHIHPACKSFSRMETRKENIEKDPRVRNCTFEYKHINYKFSDKGDKERLVHHFAKAIQPVLSSKYDYEDGLYYGLPHKQNGSKYLTEHYLCRPILCYIDQINNTNSVRRFSLDPVMAKPNHFVTGIRWVIINKTINMEIREGRYKGIELDPSSVTWTTSQQPPKNVSVLSAEKKTFRLDDVVLPSGYIVTGVAFAEDEEQRIVLNVYGKLAQYNLEEESEKFTAKSFEEKRKKIDLFDTAPSEYSPAGIENEVLSKPIGEHVVDFQPTGLLSDAGQTTVPYLDIQEVVTKPPTHIGGVGTYYKGVEGFGGYIGLKLLSFDIADQIPESTDPLFHFGVSNMLNDTAYKVANSNNTQKLLKALSNAFLV